MRLPAGKYVTREIVQWTHLYDADHNELSKSGTTAARMLLNNLTPAELIPEVASTNDLKPPVTAHQVKQGSEQLYQPETSKPDDYHKRKYKEHHLWFAWNEQYLIDLFNTEHTIDDFAVYEYRGMINASEIGRPERTASVSVTPDSKHFTDFGKGAMQPDGRQTGGDPFEYYILHNHLDKSEELRKLGQKRNREARDELLRAAKAGETPAAWVMEIITPAGRTIYNENAARYEHPTLEEHEAREHSGG